MKTIIRSAIKPIFTLIALGFWAGISFAQTPSQYSFAGSSAAYAPIVGTDLANESGDDVGNGNLSIGFTFTYNGTSHTIFSAGSNGLIKLDDATSAYTSGYPFTNALASNALVIAPLWDDIITTGPILHFLSTGSLGIGCFI